jgi:hypothetical protein
MAWKEGFSPSIVGFKTKIDARIGNWSGASIEV